MAPTVWLIALLVLTTHIACGTEHPSTPIGPSGIDSRVGCSSPNTSGDPNTSSPPQCVRFAGFEWVLKSSPRFEPGPNVWTDDPAHIWVDDAGLHLTVAERNGQWYAVEATLNRSLGYGTYTFETSTDVAQLDPQVVLGLFTYNYVDPNYSHREIDIEFSPRLGLTPGAGGHFTVQPFARPGNSLDFPISSPWDGSHRFEWRPGRVTFQSRGVTWAYTGPDVPEAGGEHARVNLWLLGGHPPTDRTRLHVAISTFRHTP